MLAPEDTPLTGPTIVRAKFESGALWLTQPYPGLPAWGEKTPLLQYLASLLDHGWAVADAAFEGFEVALELKPADPQKTVAYTLQAMQTTTTGLTVLPKSLLDELKRIMVHHGWREFAMSNTLADLRGGTWTVILWEKETPRLAARF